MSALSSIEDPNNWFVSHRSCSQDARHAHVDGRLAHCGVCGNCLLRRVSAHAAGINDESLYLFADIQAPTLEASAGKHRPTAMRAFSDLANNSVTSMKRFAALATGDESTRWRMAADLARYDHESPAEKHEKLLGLLVQHQKEWDSFLSICGGHSWISKIEAE